MITRLRLVGGVASRRSIVRMRPHPKHSKTKHSGRCLTLGELRINPVRSPQWAHRGGRGWAPRWTTLGALLAFVAIAALYGLR